MLLPPDDVDPDRLRSVVGEQYDLAGQEPRFVPLGEDSWAFATANLWISVRRDLRGHHPAAYEVAELLRRRLDFVLAPLPGRDGRIVRTVDGRPVVVFPFVPATQLSPQSVTDDELDELVRMLRQVHAMRDLGAGLPVEDFRLSFDADLDAALAFADGPPPRSNAYQARLHRLLSAHRDWLEARRAELRELADVCANASDAMVLTHGEPSAANVLRGPDGLLLADWGGAMLAPPERDWFHVMRTLGAELPCRPEFLRFYQIRWELSEIAEYASRFRLPRPGDAEDVAMWRRLLRYLPE